MDAPDSDESLPEFSASEDEWNPEEKKGLQVTLKQVATSAVGQKPRTVGRKGKQSAVKKVPLLPTRVSRRIATRLGRDIPEDAPETRIDVPVEPVAESSDFSTEEEEEKTPKKKRAVKRGRKPKQIKDETIKLTTFTVEEMYKKYRPDLAGPARSISTARKSKTELKEEDEDDVSSGDDYLVDPDELNLDSEFFEPLQTSDAIVFDCNAGLNLQESEDEDKPLSSLKNEDASSTEFNQKLIQQINQSSQDCMKLVKLAEMSKRMESERAEMELVRKKRAMREVKQEEEDVSNLLLAGEKIKVKHVKPSGSRDFVAVEPKKDKQPEKTVQITLKFETPQQGKPQRKKIDLLTAIKRLMNREKRQNQIYLHKVTILCWIGHGTFLNKTLGSASLVQSCTKRLLPSTSCRPKGLTNLLYFDQVTRYFRKVVKLKNNVMYFRAPGKLPPLQATLKYQILKRAAFSKRDYILLFLLMLRSLSIHCRLVMSLVVPPKQVPSSDLYRMNPKSQEELDADRRLLLSFRKAPKHSTIFKVKEKLAALVQKDSEQMRRDAARKRRREGFSATMIPQLDGGNDELLGSSSSRHQPLKKLKLMEGSFLDVDHNVNAKAVKKAKKEEPTFPDELDEEVRRRREKILAAYRASKEQKALAKAKAEEELGVASGLGPVRPRGRLSAKELARRKLPGVDMWVEVYCEHEDKWITIDVLSGKVHCLEDIVDRASQPISYVLAWNNDGTIKDVSPRYISRLGSKKHKIRVDDTWLEQSLRRYRARRPTRRDRSEDLKFDKLLNKRPFPEQIGEYKNHPRFAIERHLLRSEAIYPRDAIVLGYIKDEPIYPRDCVHVLFSREGWLRQAKTVKMYEEPYKTVKAKAKFDRFTGASITGLQTELFGAWQVEDYEPPVAENGLVPRSAYGNVDLFKPCMLPKGTVHLQLPGLNKVCKRMRVDCASAIIGFEYKNNACQAVYDGYVICEEFRDEVIDEWYQDQVELERKEDEKNRKRIYGNWRRLVMGLFIRKKLKDRYNFDNF